MPDNETLKNAAAFIAFLLAGLWAYFRSPKPQPPVASPVLAGVGMELGNREQTERLIAAINRVADEIANRKTDEMTDTMNELLERLRRKEGG